MDETIIRVISGLATPSEEARVEAWRAESPENETRFVETRRVWELTAPVGRGQYADAPDAEAIMGGAEGRASVTALDSRRRRRNSRRTVMGTLALAATVAAVALGTQFFGGGTGTPVGPSATFVAGAGPVTQVLDDGSVVRLAAGSELDAWAGESQRRFALRGRAFFAVRHDTERPFVVEAGGMEARVLGTRFELSYGGGSLRTVVVDGRVAVTNEVGRVAVGAGAVGTAETGSPPVVTQVGDVYTLLDWPDGLLLFQATPLSTAAREVARRFDRSVVVTDEALGGLRVTAFFEDESFEEVVQALCDVSGASCSLTETGALLAAGPPR